MITSRLSVKWFLFQPSSQATTCNTNSFLVILCCSSRWEKLTRSPTSLQVCLLPSTKRSVPKTRRRRTVNTKRMLPRPASSRTTLSSTSSVEPTLLTNGWRLSAGTHLRQDQVRLLWPKGRCQDLRRFQEIRFQEINIPLWVPHFWGGRSRKARSRRAWSALLNRLLLMTYYIRTTWTLLDNHACSSHLLFCSSLHKVLSVKVSGKSSFWRSVDDSATPERAWKRGHHHVQ